MELITSFGLSIVANFVSSKLESLFQKDTESKLENAYKRALRKWTKHDIEWESRKYKERLVDLADYLQNPTKQKRLPSSIELLNYYQSELQKDNELWSIVEGTLLKNITAILVDTNERVCEIRNYLDKLNISQDAFMDSVYRNLDFQLKRNITSGKYLEDTYLEVDELKERLRFFVEPDLFFGLTRERVRRLNFDDLKWKLSEKNDGNFEFDADCLADNVDTNSFELLYEESRRLSSYLDLKYKELHNGGNTRYFQSRKINKLKELNDCHFKRVFILTSKAGQGKTNIICDLANNVLLRRKIPAVYLNGYELDENRVEVSFANRFFPTKNYSLDDILQTAKVYCERNKVPFVFVIDGLNENASPRRLKADMESFLSAILQYDFVKVIISCRTEYYDIHFQSIGQLYGDDTIIEKDINNRLNDTWEKLKEVYFRHFSIECPHISEHIINEFCDNLLLFRIFCEVNQGRHLHGISSIAKEPLFDSYCEIMIKRVGDELSLEGINSAPEIIISEFLKDVIDAMITKGTFSNIPLPLLLKNANEQRYRIINRFLDNNVMVRKDLVPENKSPFKNSEVINFTYDEFRDYLVAHYLVDITLTDNENDFRRYVTTYTSSEHQLSEGLTRFLFFYVRRTGNRSAIEVLKQYAWYKLVFKEMIWDLDERYLEDEDIHIVQDYLKDNNVTVSRCLVYWGRWDTQKYNRLNIRILLNYLSGLDYCGLKLFFDNVWPETSDSQYHWIVDRSGSSPREKLISQVKETINSTNQTLRCTEQRNLFELILYLSILNSSARNLYEEYLQCTQDFEQASEVMTNTRCYELKALIKKWLR